MILYQSFGGDYYALCSTWCQWRVSAYLSDPDCGPRFTEAIGYGDAPFACWWCGTAIDPSTWGTPLETLTEP